MSRSVFCVLAWLVPAAALGDAVLIEVQQTDRRYAVTVDAWLAAPVATLHALLTDYEHLSQLNDSILRSEVLATLGPTSHRVYIFAEICVSVFCRTLEQTQGVRQREDGDIVEAIVPEAGDFRWGFARWHFEPGENGTWMRFESEFEPAFFVPPLIGPMLIKHALRRETLETVEKLEALAKGG